MKIVLDTNCLLLIISKKGSFYSLFEQIIFGNITLVLTNEVCSEYEEIIERVFSHEAAEFVVKSILNTSNTLKLSYVYYNWNLIVADPDDNKFIDAYVSGSADYLVTNDKHFDVLNSIDFPKINIINLQDFMKLI